MGKIAKKTNKKKQTVLYKDRTREGRLPEYKVRRLEGHVKGESWKEKGNSKCRRDKCKYYTEDKRQDQTSATKQEFRAGQARQERPREEGRGRLLE